MVDAPELNLTWSLLSGGSFNASYSKELKELMMTLVGTVIYVREGSGKDTVTRAIPIAGQDLVGFLFGRPDTQVLESEAFRLRCVEEDGDDRCLSVKKTTLDEVNLPYEFMKAASNYRNPEFGRFRQTKSSQLFDYQRVQSFFKLLSCVHARACL